MNLPKESTLQNIYGESTDSRQRFERLSQRFTAAFGKTQMEYFTSPGRTEIVGNHTDHNGGKVMAASINMDTIGAAWPNESDIIEIISEEYDEKITINLRDLESIPLNQGTTSLVAGIAVAVQKFGFQISGFQAYISTEVISSAGVSSSASFEMLLCTMINYFFNDNQLSCVEYARIGQYAENHNWSKASGLMDQMACAVGGTILLDFSDDVSYKKIDFSFGQFDYQLVIVNTGKGHADLSHEYSEVPAEMKQVANCLGKDRLSEISLENMVRQIPGIEEKTGNDRAILRALHFFEENARVDDMIKAVESKDIRSIINIIRSSGTSSWELLQNCCSISNYKEQKVALYLALTELFLQRIGDGCCRVHGGGFAGVIMSIIPSQFNADYIKYISEYAGGDNVYPLKIRNTGAVHLN